MMGIPGTSSAATRSQLRTTLGVVLGVLAAAAPHPGSAAQSAAVSGAASPQFAIREYRVLGNTTLEVREVERAVYGFLGEGKSFADIQKARETLQAAYRAHDLGTVIVDIPEQTVADGIVRLRVTEGRLRVANVTGARYFSERQIKEQIPAAAVGAVPRLGELQNEIAAVNSQSADRTVTPVLKSGPTVGTVDLALSVQDHLPLHGSLEIDNQYTVGTTHLRANGSLDYANLFGDLDDVTLQYQMSPEKPSQVGVYAVGYTTAATADGLRGSLIYINSSSSVPTVSALGVLGKGQIISARLTLQSSFTQESTQSVSAGVDYKHFLQSIEVDPTTSLSTPISYMNFTVGYSGEWRRQLQQWSLSANANFGMPGIVNDADSFENKRYLARPNYFYLHEDGSFTQTLPLGFKLRLRLAGQWADMPLVSNEDYSISGADGVRGYLEAEELGDSAWKGTLQLNSMALPPRWLSAQWFAFYDLGRTMIIEPLPGDSSHAFLKSAGTGVALTSGSVFQSLVTWAYPLANSTSTRAHDSWVLFSVRGAF